LPIIGYRLGAEPAVSAAAVSLLFRAALPPAASQFCGGSTPPRHPSRGATRRTGQTDELELVHQLAQPAGGMPARDHRASTARSTPTVEALLQLSGQSYPAATGARSRRATPRGPKRPCLAGNQRSAADRTKGRHGSSSPTAATTGDSASASAQLPSRALKQGLGRRWIRSVSPCCLRVPAQSEPFGPQASGPLPTPGDHLGPEWAAPPTRGSSRAVEADRQHQAQPGRGSNGGEAPAPAMPAGISQKTTLRQRPSAAIGSRLSCRRPPYAKLRRGGKSAAVSARWVGDECASGP